MAWKKILIADDNENIVKLLELTLSLKKHQIIAAYDGEEALQKARQLLPDLIILDVVMPKLSGFEVLRELKKDSQTKDVPVIMLTCAKDKEDLETGFALGALDYISKPFNLADLTSFVESVLAGGKESIVVHSHVDGKFNIAFIGPSKGKDLLFDSFLSHPQVKVLGYWALPESKAVKEAKDLGINVVQTKEELLKIPGLDLIIDSGSNASSEFVKEADSRKLQILSGRLKNFVSELLEEYQKDIGARQKLTRELIEKQNLVGKLLSRLIKAQEEERRRISIDIHDGITQSLTGILTRVQISQKLLEKKPLEALVQLNEARVMILQNIKETKQIIFNLRPPILDDLGLIHSLENYIKKFSLEHKIKVIFDCNNRSFVIPEMYEISIFRLVQEGLNNIYKHSRSKSAEVRLHFKPNFIDLAIVDEGCGFDFDEIRKKIDDGTSIGLAGMRERVLMFGGNFKVRTCPGEGTAIFITLPAGNGSHGAENRSRKQ